MSGAIEIIAHDSMGGRDTPSRGLDLTAWADQGVMLLNRVLSVEPGNPARKLYERHGFRHVGT